MIPLGKVYQTGLELEEIQKTLESGWWAGAGPTTGRLESLIKGYLGLDESYNVCAVSSCTTALELCLRYHNVIGKSVFVPSYSFVASAFAASHAGGDPFFIDVDENGWNMSASVLDRVLSGCDQPGGWRKPKAIVPVHQYGIPYDNRINDIAEKYEVPIVEDAACAFGSEMDGVPVGKSKNLVCFSLHARKTVTSGEGGFIIIPDTIDPTWFYSMRAFGIDSTPFQRHGVKKYKEASYDMIGFNMKISDLQAAVAIAQVRGYDDQLEKRRGLASQFIERLTVQSLNPPENCNTNWQNFRILLPTEEKRESLLVHLRDDKEIMAKRCIQPIHLESPYVNGEHSCPNTVDVSNRGIWLPFFADMTQEQVDTIVGAVNEFCS